MLSETNNGDTHEIRRMLRSNRKRKGKPMSIRLKSTFRFLLAVLLLSGCPSRDIDVWSDIVPAHPETTPKPPGRDFSVTNTNLLATHNREREYKGRTGLKLDRALVDYAQAHSDWMARKNNLKHSDIGVLLGKFHTVGENIAWNQEDENEVTESWMNSKGHRENIMNRSFGRIGFGVSKASDGSLYWCAVFGD